MTPIELLSKLSDKVDMFVRLFRDDIRDYAPIVSIELLSRLSERLDRLNRLKSGDKSDDAPRY